MKVRTKEVTVTTLIGVGIVFDNQTREGGLGVDGGSNSEPSGYIALPSLREGHDWNDRRSDLLARERTGVK